MSAEGNIASFRRWLEDGWQMEDPGVLIDELWAPNMALQSPPIEVKSSDEYKQTVASIKSSFPDIKYTLDDAVAAEDKVGYHWTCRGTHQGEFLGVAPTGKEITVTGSGIARFENGKIAEVRENWSGLPLLQQLGAIPSEE